jgi:hypothetical protein
VAGASWIPEGSDPGPGRGGLVLERRPLPIQESVEAARLYFRAKQARSLARNHSFKPLTWKV